MLNASKLSVITRGFAGQVGVKWTKGFETVAFFKGNVTEAVSGTIAISEKGWFTLYIYDNERNSRLVHVLITDLGGVQ
jgi:hypothetical protein